MIEQAFATELCRLVNIVHIQAIAPTRYLKIDRRVQTSLPCVLEAQQHNDLIAAVLSVGV